MKFVYLKPLHLVLLVFFIAGFDCRGLASKTPAQKDPATFFTADNPDFQYTGRIVFTNPKLPRFWSPGVYVDAYFEGSTCEIALNDEVPWDNTHNYVSIVLDDQPVRRIKLKKKENVLDFSKDLGNGKHKLRIYKTTESGQGYLEFVGLRCEKLLKPEPKPTRKIEFYGNSITCGTGSDLSEFPCDSAEWYDQHNAYMAYGPVTARSLNAQWMLTSVSGIGLVHSCCDMNIVMPDVYDKVNLRANQIPWDFSNYQPDVVTIALGQNDGIQDSILFCSAYVKFIQDLRGKYPEATIVCLTSPMANEELVAVLKKYISSVVHAVNAAGDKNVCSFFFSRSYNDGCGGHPDLEQHTEISAELTKYIKQLKGW